MPEQTKTSSVRIPVQGRFSYLPTPPSTEFYGEAGIETLDDGQNVMVITITDEQNGTECGTITMDLADVLTLTEEGQLCDPTVALLARIAHVEAALHAKVGAHVIDLYRQIDDLKDRLKRFEDRFTSDHK